MSFAFPLAIDKEMCYNGKCGCVSVGRLSLGGGTRPFFVARGGVGGNWHSIHDKWGGRGNIRDFVH